MINLIVWFDIDAPFGKKFINSACCTLNYSLRLNVLFARETLKEEMNYKHFHLKKDAHVTIQHGTFHKIQYDMGMGPHF